MDMRELSQQDPDSHVGGILSVSEPAWFCAGCTFKDAEHDVRVHAARMRHEFGASEVFRMAPLEVTSIGVTGFGAKGDMFSFVHANFCPVADCSSRVLEDDEVLEHMRRHAARSEWQPPR
jgi:hypothetical protein